MRFPLACSLFAALVLTLPRVSAVPDTSADERLLRAARLGSDGPALLDFLNKRVSAGRDRERIVRLARQLVEARGDQADRVFGELVAFGPAALTPLKEELKNVGAGKSRSLLKECVQWIEGPEASNLARAVVRQIGRRKPEKAVAVLLDYLGAAEDELTIAEVRHALTALAGSQAPTIALFSDATVQRQCRDAWAAWWRANDGPALLDYFRKRTPNVVPDRATDLVARLHSRSFRVRQQAEEELIKL